MNNDNKDEFATTPGPSDPDETNLSPNDNPDADAESQTAIYHTSGWESDQTPASKPSNTKPTNPVDKLSSEVPKTVGRYTIKKLLGRGGFGEVYLGLDEQLRREVAIKLTFGSRVGRSAVKMFLAEAQMLAELDHPNIVPVYDIGTTERGDIFIVSKLIDGADLATRIEQNRPSRELSLEIIAAIADALHYAHSKGLIHRDIKPANILLDKTDRPYLADFGIALRETDQTGAGEIAGTPAYMSPEQARGEGHLMTNQSDIYSLGVVLYELLSGRRPFRAKSAHELIRMVQTSEIRTPRTFDATISRELERVCLKALARRPSDRFAIAKDFADEVRDLISSQLASRPLKGNIRSSPSGDPPASNSDRISGGDAADPRRTPSELPSAGQLDSDLRSGPVRVVPKGLRSFDEKDSEFFLELLPGPFDRSGLPEGLRFWKNRIEASDIDESFRIGLVYGPSGCGKSSLMKAGLLPRLSPKIESIYIEATPEDTTGKLLREIQKRIPEASGTNLAEALSIIRRRKLVPSGGKLLLVIDQFEQWLYAHKNYADTELTNALRQCDGVTIQAIVMVRDDFWLSVSRFLRELDVPILERENSALVDLFDLDHAKKVLALFGRAYDKLPEDRTAWTQDHKDFLQQAVEGLSQEEKVISVRLALFAEMMKSKTWAPKTLADLGGIAGVGVTFLEETFGDKHAPIQFRQHQEGVRSLLGALLPAVGTNIKGHSRSIAELQKIVGYDDRPREFAELVGLLDKNLRLITPADDSQQSQQESRSYQLTHDYLVPSLRDWLNQKQRETKKGRAELKLAERAATWGANQENKQLPTLWEWMQIRRWTDSKRWSPSEQAVMYKAGRLHVRNWGAALLGLLVTGGVIGYVFQQQNLRSQQEKITLALDSLQKTLGPSVPVNIEKLIDMKRSDLIRPDLEKRYSSAEGSLEKLSLGFALARFGQVEADYLISQIDSIEDRDTGNLIRALSNDPKVSIEKLKTAATECTTVDLQRRKARLAIVALGIGDTDLPIDAAEFEGRPDPGVRTWFIDEFPRWEIDSDKLVNIVRDSPSPALRSAVCLGIGQKPVKQISSEEKTRISELATKWYSLPDSSTHSAVTWLMRQWDIPEPSLADAKQVIDGRNWFNNSRGVTFVRITPPPVELKPLTDPLEQVRESLAQMEQATPEEKTQADFRYRRGIFLLQTGQYEPALADFDALLSMELGERMSQVRGEVAQFRLLALARLKRIEEADAALAQWSASEPDAVYRDYVESLVPMWLGRKEVAVAGLEKGLANAESVDRGTLYNLACAVALFASGEDASVDEKHTWTDRSIDLLQRWSENSDQDRIRMRLEPDLLALHSDNRFVKLAADRSGVPEHPYWIASCEVTRGDFEAFINDNQYQGEKPTDRKESELYHYKETSPTLYHPVQNVSWYDAVMYCNWLSRREGLTPVYRNAGKQMIKDWRDPDKEIEVSKWEEIDGATGYRLPKDLEWEYACRAGSKTDWSSGSDESLLAAYCQMVPSKLASPSGKKLPNAWGMHDMHGNMWEWCWDLYDSMGSDGVSRGGSWGVGAANCRWVDRNLSSLSYRYFNVGFRLALSSPSGIPKSPEAGSK